MLYSKLAHTLSDIELAILLSLIARQHCIIRTEDACKEQLREELRLISLRGFEFTHASIDCDAETTIDDIASGILVPTSADQRDENEEHHAHLTRVQTPRLRTPIPETNKVESINGKEKEDSEDALTIANVVVLTGLSNAARDAQVQVLELIRKRRIFTHTAIHTAPKHFTVVIIMTTTEPPLLHHLNDLIFMSHSHGMQDGFPSSDRFSKVNRSHERGPLVSKEDIESLQSLERSVSITAEIKAYLHNIVVFLRMHRAVNGGISPQATRDFELLAKSLAPLHDTPHLTPSLVALAAPKIYRHRIRLATVETERSMQYGSDPAAIEDLLKVYTPERVIREVLDEIDAPL